MWDVALDVGSLRIVHMFFSNAVGLGVFGLKFRARLHSSSSLHFGNGLGHTWFRGVLRRLKSCAFEHGKFGEREMTYVLRRSI